MKTLQKSFETTWTNRPKFEKKRLKVFDLKKKSEQNSTKLAQIAQHHMTFFTYYFYRPV